MSIITPDRISLNTATVRQKWNLEQSIEGCLRHGLGGISPWRHQLAEMGLNAAAALIRRSGLGVSGLCRAGLYTREGALTSQVLEDNRKAVDEAASIGASCLVLVVGGLAPESKDIADARNMVFDGLAASLEYAKKNNVVLAIEPLHPMYAADRSCVNSLRHALDLCDRLGEGIGVALDVYHVWWDPQLFQEITRAGKSRLSAFHLCDWLVPTTDLLNDRGMMGDGVIDIAAIRRAVEAQGFSGLNEVEIFSEHNWWKRDPDEVLKTIKARCRENC